MSNHRFPVPQMLRLVVSGELLIPEIRHKRADDGDHDPLLPDQNPLSAGDDSSEDGSNDSRLDDDRQHGDREKQRCPAHQCLLDPPRSYVEFVLRKLQGENGSKAEEVGSPTVQ